jgi:DoxX-like family
MQSKKMLWTGRIISALVILFLVADSVGKVMKLAPYLEGTVKVGYPASLVVPLGIVLLICTVVYAIPITSVLGAILLTGYLGGATATHVRIGQPFWFPVIVGVLLWAALFLREERLRALIPLRK